MSTLDLPGLTGSTKDDHDLTVLAHLHRARAENTERVSQRSIAKALGLSVGLTNAILKRLVEKGFVMVRRVNHNNAHYLVTPQGIQQIGTRSYFYLRRTIGHIVRYKESLRQFCRQQAAAGMHQVALVGESDLDFLLEWCVHKEGLRLTRIESYSSGQPIEHGTAVVFAESYTDPSEAAALSLHRLILGIGTERVDARTTT